MFLDGFFEDAQHVRCLDGTVGVDVVALLGKLVDHIEHPELASEHGMVADEVPCPDVIAVLRLLGRPGRETLAPLSRLRRRNLQTLLAAHALHQLLAHGPALLDQLTRDLAVAEARILLRHLHNLSCYGPNIDPLGTA